MLREEETLKEMCPVISHFLQVLGVNSKPPNKTSTPKNMTERLLITLTSSINPKDIAKYKELWSQNFWWSTTDKTLFIVFPTKKRFFSSTKQVCPTIII